MWCNQSIKKIQSNDNEKITKYSDSEFISIADKITFIVISLISCIFYIEDKSLQQLAMLSDDIKIVQLIFDYLQTKDQINDLNYILKMAKNDEIKSIIYKYIKK